MLILCIGPDTFRAQEKARELEVAFRQKFDLGGSSVEHLGSGKDAIKQILERANTASLFSSRRLMRATDLVLECPKASQSPLLQAFSKDPENIITISVESEPPPEAVMKVFAAVPKFFKYDFPIQTSSKFFKWLCDRAKALGFRDEERLKHLAEISEGDSWLAWNELTKLAAGSDEDLQRFYSPTIFEFAERYLKGTDNQYDFLSDSDALREAQTVFLSQARAAVRVRDNDTQDLHPYLVKKMRNVAEQTKKFEQSLACILQALMLQRVGMGNEEETNVLL